ncbi:carbohydrate esterase family 4 protein [Peniophora sp. CONT]|nr:carbohydrate esterase family 4 protein [Peniophora sp. CONT]
MFFATLIASLSVASVAVAAPGHDHVEARQLPDTWYQPATPRLDAVYRRADSSSSNTFAAVGSAAWSSGFPVPGDKLNGDDVPQAWKDALAAAIAAGKIPDIPVATATGGNPTYGGQDPGKLPICSGTYGCRLPESIWDAPNNTIGISFDDGPLAGSSDTLYSFLKNNSIPATHFFIGINILQNAKEFTTAYETLQGDIAVHTWTHPYMTTQSNELVLAELGWTAQLIYNSTGGRIPRFWRPPYGDTDARVSAIAREVFGMTTIQWNHDTADWTLTTGDGYTTPAKIHSQFQSWLTGARSPGLIVLEHELSQQSVQAFIDAYPLIVQNNWNIVSVVDIDGNGTYQNAINSTSAILGNSNITSGKNLGSAYALASSMAAASASPSATAGSQQASPSASSAGSSSSPGAGSNVSHSGAAALTGAPFASLSALVFGALLGALLL